MAKAKYVIWQTVIDERTHDLCSSKDGKEFLVDKIGEEFAGHVIDLGDEMFRCRCTTRRRRDE